ncbi:hypothetical protein KSF_000340 [Reticulibacter mediterranei]|uniref:Uncharacterized protein n=1 Tax=Reticulibacter mediterranei TaxID=2778369 RepID=A0A8J3IGT7_9CHLR|nr:hypothetical protein KSF_000340 [Reticulibacter mediterranei]
MREVLLNFCSPASRAWIMLAVLVASRSREQEAAKPGQTNPNHLTRTDPYLVALSPYCTEKRQMSGSNGGSTESLGHYLSYLEEKEAL